jgi:hypothetical protein
MWLGRVPADILAAIEAAAKEEWPGDHDMQNHPIDAEAQGYVSNRSSLLGLRRCSRFALDRPI